MGRLKQLGGRLGGLPARVAPLPKEAEGFYTSPEWKALRASRVGDPDWFAAKRRAKPGERLILDHVVERRDGGDELDPRNTQWLTMSEHQAKTARRKGERARGEVKTSQGWRP